MGRRKKQSGGYLRGPSHEKGGIPAYVPGQPPIELEGKEFIINAKTTEALGVDFLEKLNRTASPYHSAPGFAKGTLPGSKYKRGGSVNRRNNMRRRKMHTGGRLHRHPHARSIQRPPDYYWNDPGLKRRGGGIRRFHDGGSSGHKRVHGAHEAWGQKWKHCEPYPSCLNKRRGGRVRRFHEGGHAHSMNQLVQQHRHPYYDENQELRHVGPPHTPLGQPINRYWTNFEGNTSGVGERRFQTGGQAAAGYGPNSCIDGRGRNVPCY